MRFLLLAFALIVSTAIAGSYLFVGGGAAPPTTIISDLFTDSNGTLISAHTPNTSPAPWVKIGACPNTTEVQSNAAVGSGSDSCYTIDAALTTGTAIMNINLNLLDTQVYFLFNFASFGDGWVLIVQPNVGLDNTYFFEYGGAGQVGVATNVFAPGAQEWKVVFGVASVSFYVNSVLITSVATPNVRAPTGWGFGLYKSGGTPATTVTDFTMTSP